MACIYATMLMHDDHDQGFIKFVTPKVLQESDGFCRWHHYMQSRSPLQPGEAVGRGSCVIPGGGGLGAGERRRESRAGDGAIII